MLTFREGGGLVDTLINKLPIELHIPGGYKFCGPGTKLEKRLEEGDRGINPLDESCREHDIFYSQQKDLAERHKADKILEHKAWQRVKSRNASVGEKTAALIVAGVMKAKRKLGMGFKEKKTFKRSLIVPLTKALRTSPNSDDDIKKSSLIALKAARAAIKKAGGKKNIRVPRIIPFKSGGILPLMPILAGLSTLGSLLGGGSAVVKTFIDAKNATKKLAEHQRHNKAMEAIGHGLYVKKYRKGYGLFVKKQKN